MSRRDLIIDCCYAVVIGAYVYIAINRMTDNRLQDALEEKVRHTFDWALHAKRIEDAVKRDGPFVVFEAIQSLPTEEAM